MIQQAPADLEARAERAVRRGELLVAIELFETLLAQVPEDERVRQRMEAVRALLQPSELVNRRRTEPEEMDLGPAAETLTDAEQAELHASSGRFSEAMECYQRALDKSPANELIRERLEELRSLAPPGARADLGGAEKLEALTPSRGSQKVDSHRSARAADAAFGPIDSSRRSTDSHAHVPAPPTPAPAKPLPRDPVALLEALLERVRGSRRPRS